MTAFPEKHTFLNRRQFVDGVTRSAAALAAFGPSDLLTKRAKTYTVQEVIDLILREGKLSKIPDTVDTIKAGSSSASVKGIVTTMFPTVEVIQKSADLGANFIIAHEPTFYNHRDAADWVPDNQIVAQKQELLKKTGMTVWRFHDYCHAIRPDVIFYGVVKKCGWTDIYKNNPVMNIPEMPLKNLVAHLKKSLDIDHVRVLGQAEHACRRIALMPGASGGQRHVQLAEKEKPDVMIVGELSEWETAEYFRDANLLGRQTALIVLGHAVSEEPGMEYFVEWLQPKLEGIKVTHIASKSPFTWY